MKISFFGTNTKITKNEFRKMTKFFCEMLLRESEIRNIDLTISFSQEDAVPRWDGYMMQLDDRYTYKVWIRPTRRVSTQQETLAHELVHLKQYIRKEICPTTGECLVPSLNHWSTKSPGYFERPTEIEAYGRTIGMIAQYKTQKKELADE